MAKVKINLSGARQKISMLNRHYIKNEIFFSKEISENLLRKTRLHLPNLSDFELLDDRAVFVTPVLVGEPMMESLEFSPTEKVQIISSYLKIIKEFEELPIHFQVNLIRPENFYIVSGELKHRGVLIVEDIGFDRPLRMHHLRQGISNVMLDFIGNDLSLYNFKSYFRDLPSKSETQSYTDIEEDIKKIYIKDLFVEENGYTEQPDPVHKALFDRLKHINFKFFLLISFLLLFLVAGALSLFGGLNMGKNTDIVPLFSVIDRNENILIIDQSYVPPGMHISEKKWSIFRNNVLVKEQSTDLVNLLLPEEGHYLIRLELKDSKGNWSPAYEENYNKKYRPENSDHLDFFKFIGANFDEEQYFSGTKSILIEKGSPKIRLKDIYLKGSILIEFMIRSSHDDPLHFNLEGFNKGNQALEHSSEIQVGKDTWTKFSLEVNSDELNELSFFFLDMENDNKIWLDDLSISSSVIQGFEF